jgi:hypothetical protein
MISKILVAIFVTKEAMIMFLVHISIGKMMKNISNSAVSVSVVEVQRLLDEGGSW